MGELSLSYAKDQELENKILETYAKGELEIPFRSDDISTPPEDEVLPLNTREVL